jgi:glycosyltransferase involved in cell wall biosynthesis
MKKILIVTILKGSAVDKLAQMIQRYNPHLDIKIFPFHGKRFDAKDLKDFEELIDWADLIDFEYWKNFQVLWDNYPHLLAKKKKIITHHNPYDLDKIPLGMADAMVVKNHTQKDKLKSAKLIPHAVDFNLMKFNEEYNGDDKVVGMVAFRIESSKGILEVAQVCKKLGYTFLLVGHVSDAAYYQQIIDTGVSIETRLDISEEDLYKAYCDMTVLVCNSKDNFESGPMPVLEAMAVGVPVLSRNVGIVQDIYNGQNLLLREGNRSDVEDLERQLKILVESKETRLKIIKAGFDTVKNYSAERMAWQYGKLYNEVLFPDQPLVSVITPVRNRKEQIAQIMADLHFQDYKNIEFVCCDDGSNDGLEEKIAEWAKDAPYPVKYLSTGRLEGYNIATARNLGIVAADGKYILFLDSRFSPEKDAIKLFVEEAQKLKEGYDKVWYFGNKGSNKKAFVENFSFIQRHQIVKAGMFNERISKYGGQSQELRERFDVQGFEFKFLENVNAKELLSANKWQKRTQDIIKMKDLIYRLNH